MQNLPARAKYNPFLALRSGKLLRAAFSINIGIHKARVSTGKAKLKNADMVYTGTSNGYLYVADIALNIDGNVYESVNVTGHTATNNWTCVYDSYHGQWQPAGCAACGAGVPCHTPSVTANFNSSNVTATGDGVAPNVNVNITAYNHAQIYPRIGTTSTTPVGSVFCSAANAPISSFTPPGIMACSTQPS